MASKKKISSKKATSKKANNSRVTQRKTAARSVRSSMVSYTDQSLEDADDPVTTFSFGIVFDINGTPVPITAKDVSKLKESGLDFELPNPVVLPTLNDALKYIETTFGVKFPDTTSLPPWLNDIIQKILNMTFTVTVFKLSIPPQGAETPAIATEKGTKFAIEIAGAFTGDPLSLPGFPIGIQGGVFGATNIPPAITS